MSFIADLHIHSHYSRATSKDLNLEHLHQWAQLKGVQVVATGDFIHPQWLDELQEKLAPAEPGLFKLKSALATEVQQHVFKACTNDVRFILSTEISNIYKKGDCVRKIHNVVFVPSFEAATKLQSRLEKIGNIRSDGRPILGLNARDLLEIVLETDDLAFLIPAHIWTPWFSVLGSKSGFDSIEECYGDLSSHIFALETGLSSDPPMNWRLSSLDRYTLVSNSDAHSPQKLAREANIFTCERSYPAMIHALKSNDIQLFGGTIEFYPEEGKYHFDGHRKCQVRMSPEETIAQKCICPVCGKPVTLGVSHRVEMLADRKPNEIHERIFPFQRLVPLPEIVAEVKGQGVNSKSVQQQVDKLLSKLGSELLILREIPLSEIEKVGGSLLAEGVRRTRTGELHIAAGYDGEFGTIRLFTDQEREQLKSQIVFFEPELTNKKPKAPGKKPSKIQDRDEENVGITVIPIEVAIPVEDKIDLNQQQLQAVRTTQNPLLIVAGPGTGKTRTLTYRIAYLINQQNIAPEHVLAVTFTNKAREEMLTRLIEMVAPEILQKITIVTFHALGALILREQCHRFDYSPNFSIYNETDRLQLLKQVAPHLSANNLDEIAQKISRFKNQLLPIEAYHDISSIYANYQHLLQRYQAFDFDDLIYQPVQLFRSSPEIAESYQRRYPSISVDEYQDINLAQYHLLRLLVTPTTHLCVIGDSDQAIYGFRGSDAQYFSRFQDDFPTAKVIHLEKNYRSHRTILDASIQMIAKNPDRNMIPIYTDRIAEGKLEIIPAYTEKAEAETVVHQIEKLIGATSFFSLDSGRIDDRNSTLKYSFEDIAVFFRLRAQSAALEEAFIRSGIPYQTLGEIHFWERKEVQEILSYLKVIHNPHSDLDLFSILNNPPRTISEQIMKTVINYQRINSLSLWQTLEKVHLISSLSETHKQPLKLIVEKIQEFRHLKDQIPLHIFIDHLIKHSGIGSYYKFDSQRVYYWKSIIEQTERWELTLSEFLEKTTLQQETDIHDPRTEKVTLMTLHASKGLEFPVVFITGCEEGLIPYHRQGHSSQNIEEERRLFYVGMTRAKNKLIFTHTASRFLYGKRHSNPPSRFLSDIDKALKEYHQSLPTPKRKSSISKKDDSQISLF